MKRIILTAVIFVIIIACGIGLMYHQNQNDVYYSSIEQDTTEVVESHINFHNIDMTDKQQIMHYIDSCGYKLSKKTSIDPEVVWYDYKKNLSIGIKYNEDEVIIMEVFNNKYNYDYLCDSIKNEYSDNYLHEDIINDVGAFIILNNDNIYISYDMSDTSIMYTYRIK